MGIDFSIKSDLSVIDLEVRQSESEEYHRRIDSLEREISYLKQFEDDSIEKDRKIKDLEDELRKTRVDTDNQIETTREDLKLKSTQLVESQIEISNLELNIKELENKIFDLEHNIGLKDIDINSLRRQLDDNKEDYDRRVKLYKDKLSDVEYDRNSLKKYLESDITSKQQSIKSLVEQKDKAQKEIEDLISFQGSLQTKIIELEYSLGIFETNLNAEKTINESKERELNDARDKIKELEESIVLNMNLKNSEINVL